MFSTKVNSSLLVLFIILFCTGLGFLACGGTPASRGSSLAEARAAAQDAEDRMNGRQPATQSGLTAQPAAAGSSSAQQGPVVNTSKTQPAWVNSVDSVYKRDQYVAAVGHASNRATAERTALSNLISIFGQSIYADTAIINTYQEVINNGKISGYTDSTDINNTIKTSASMDTVVGAEVREIWYDSKSVYYAVAVMDKAKTAQMYRDMITANLNMIKNLTTMSAAEKNTMEGYSRYQFAAAVADINISYGNLLNVIGSAPPSALKRGADYRLEAVDIAKAIPIGLRVQNDKAGRIQGAFAKAITDLGFRSGGNNSPYLLDVAVTTNPAEYPNQTIKYTRIELSANLIDTKSNTVLFPYNYNGREGGLSQSEADNTAYAAVEKEINQKYANLFSNYVSQLIPQK